MNVSLFLSLLAGIIFVANGNVLHVCFFCGKQCKKDAPNLETFKEEVAAVVNKKLADSDIDMQIQIDTVKFSKKTQPIMKFSDKIKGENGLAKARIQFWEKKFGKLQKDHGCGVGFLLSSPRDKFWKSLSKDGIAGVASACKKEGTGILKLSTDADVLGTLLSHEIGHQLSMDHDCKSVDYLSKLASMDAGIKELVDPIIANCGPQHCVEGFIMDPAPLAYSPYPAFYSECSKAYFNFFIKSGSNALLSQMYHADCIIEN